MRSYKHLVWITLASLKTWLYIVFYTFPHSFTWGSRISFPCIIYPELHWIELKVRTEYPDTFAGVSLTFGSFQRSLKQSSCCKNFCKNMNTSIFPNLSSQLCSRDTFPWPYRPFFKLASLRDTVACSSWKRPYISLDILCKFCLPGSCNLRVHEVSVLSLAFHLM